jgi:hypothetical protein
MIIWKSNILRCVCKTSVVVVLCWIMCSHVKLVSTLSIVFDNIKEACLNCIHLLIWINEYYLRCILPVSWVYLPLLNGTFVETCCLQYKILYPSLFHSFFIFSKFLLTLMKIKCILLQCFMGLWSGWHSVGSCELSMYTLHNTCHELIGN